MNTATALPHNAKDRLLTTNSKMPNANSPATYDAILWNDQTDWAKLKFCPNAAHDVINRLFGMPPSHRHRSGSQGQRSGGKPHDTHFSVSEY